MQRKLYLIFLLADYIVHLAVLCSWYDVCCRIRPKYKIQEILVFLAFSPVASSVKSTSIQ